MDGPKTPGRHWVTFDAAGLASGTYLYRMQAGDYQGTHDGRQVTLRRGAVLSQR